MNHALRHCFSTGIVGLFLASTCYAGVDSPVNTKQTQDPSSVGGLRPVAIVSEPVGARILINGDYVGITPLQINFAVDSLGRAVRDIELRAVAPQPMITQEVRRFPAAGTDGDSSRIPHVVDFDLNIQKIVVIR